MTSSSRTRQIVFIARHYWPRPGAATVRLRALVAALIRLDFTVIVLTNSKGLAEHPAVGPDGEEIQYLRGDVDTGFGIRRVMQLLVFALRATWKVWRIAPVAVVSDPPPTNGLAALLGGRGRVTYYVADSWSEMLGQGGGRSARAAARLVEPIENFVLRKARLVISVRDNLTSRALRAGARDPRTAPYGTDTEIFALDGDDAKDEPWNTGLPYFLYAGNYGVIQGGRIFVDAARRLREKGYSFRVVFMGYGAEGEFIEAAASDDPTTFASIPMQRPEVAARAYRGAAAGLASMRPLAVAEQTRPAKALASIACGCPVLFAGNRTFGDIVERHNLGRAVPYDVEEVTDAMESFLQRPYTSGERASIADYGRTRLSMSATADELASLVVARCVTSPRG